MRMELGGFCELTMSGLRNKNDNIFEYLSEYNTIYTSNGRSAIKLIANHLRSGKILLPEYICESISNSFCDNETAYYEVNEQLEIDIESLERMISKEISAVFLINYFGFIQNKKVLSYLREKRKEYGFVIIEDTTHSIFTEKNVIGDYCICSLRKWFPCEGGVLYSKLNLNAVDISCMNAVEAGLMFDARVMKYYSIKDSMDTEDTYMKIYADAEHAIDEDKTIKCVDSLSETVLKSISVTDVVERRRNNAKMVYEQLSDVIMPLRKEYNGEVLIAVPVICENRDSLRKYLMNNRIFCAVHWPQNDESTEKAKLLSKKLISIMIDQRYDKRHMMYLIEKIRDFNEKNMCGYNN